MAYLKIAGTAKLKYCNGEQKLPSAKESRFKMKEKIYQVYWRHKVNRDVHFGYVKAVSADAAFDIVTEKLREGYNVTAVYESSENAITPQSLTINFHNTTDYELF